MHKLNVLLFCVVFALTAQAQQNGVRIVEGSLIDSKTKEPVAFATIGIAGSALGTSSNAEGYFSFKVPAEWNTPTLQVKISSIGYENTVLENPLGFQQVSMIPSITMLKETIVFDKDLSAATIVKRAFSKIKKNYNTKPFVYKNFYRHYCKDDTVYGRLIEAATEVYKRKGYKVQQTKPGDKDEVRVTQLRRSLDRTKVSSNHVPIALYSILGTDFVGFQVKDASTFTLILPNTVSVLRKYLRKIDFTLEAITEFDEQQVYEISYRLQESKQLNTGLSMGSTHTGKLFINTKDYAFVKVETKREATRDTVTTLAFYKKYQDKYYLYHAIKEGTNMYVNPDKSVFNHWYHIESITAEIKTERFPKFNGKEPSREDLFSVRYDSTFWNTYNILKATPLEDKIVEHIAGDKALDKQFLDADSAERIKFFSGKDDEERLNILLKARKGMPIYIDFWASWCGPCVAEMPASKALLEKYKGKVLFVYASIDANVEAWRTAVKKLELENLYMAYHFRIGTQSDAAILLDITSIPRYVLIDRNGNFIDLNAKRPSDPELEKDFERLLAEKIEN